MATAYRDLAAAVERTTSDLDGIAEHVRMPREDLLILDAARGVLSRLRTRLEQGAQLEEESRCTAQ